VVVPEAREGLQNIVEYLEEEVSYQTADHVRKAILAAINTLSERPHKNAPVKQISDEEITYRRLLQWKYRIIYSINEDHQQIRVVDISSGKRGPAYLEEVKKR
jgi:plasmid stabilization system protein ParE